MNSSIYEEEEKKITLGGGRKSIKPKSKTTKPKSKTTKPKSKTTKPKSKKTKGGMMELDGTDSQYEYAPALAEDEYIKTMVDATPGWYEPGTPDNKKPITVDLNALINDHQFGRTTPDNKFVVASDIIKTPSGVQMIGGAKPKKSTKPKKTTTKPKKTTTMPKKTTTKPKKTTTKPKKTTTKPKKTTTKPKKSTKPMKKTKSWWQF